MNSNKGKHIAESRKHDFSEIIVAFGVPPEPDGKTLLLKIRSLVALYEAIMSGSFLPPGYLS